MECEKAEEMQVEMSQRELAGEVVKELRRYYKGRAGFSIDIVDACVGENSIGTKRIVVFVADYIRGFTRATFKQIIEDKFSIWTEIRSNTTGTDGVDSPVK